MTHVAADFAQTREQFADQKREEQEKEEGAFIQARHLFARWYAGGQAR